MITDNLRTAVWVCLSFLLIPTVFAAPLQSGYTIQGLQGDALKNAQNQLSQLETQHPEQITTVGTQAIQDAIKPYGYFKAQVSLQQHVFNVIPGPVIHIQSVAVSITGEGAHNTLLQTQLSHFPLKRGQPLLTEKYSAAKATLFNTALKAGYLNPTFTTQKITINLSRYTCNIQLVLDTGPRSYFGNVTFSPTPLDDSLLYRYLPFKPGQPFSSEKLLTLQNDLSSSQYFKKISVNSKTESAKNHIIPIHVKLHMKKWSQYLAGLGFGTDTGPRATFGANFFYINRYGHAISSQAMVSSVQSSAGISYKIPGDNPATDQYTLNENFSTNHLNQGSSQTQQFGVNYIKKLAHHWQRTYSLNYNIEQFKFNDMPGQASYLIIPGINFTRITTAQNRIFTNEGNFFSLNIQGALREFASNNTFFQAEIQDKAITHFSDNDRLIFRGDVGYTYTDSLDTLPLSLRFYAGGAQSVRGFSYQSIGPGKYLAVGSAEYQHHIKGNWYGTTFYDIGNAMDNTDQAFARGVGAGIMWASPIGPIEITVAKAMSLPGKPMRIQFTMGPDL